MTDNCPGQSRSGAAVPSGYVDHAENVSAAAAREVEEEAGWRPRTMRHLVTYQPAIGTLDHPKTSISPTAPTSPTPGRISTKPK